MFTQTMSLAEQPRSFGTGCIAEVGRAACSRCASVVGDAVACDDELCEPPPQPATIAAATSSETIMDRRMDVGMLGLRSRAGDASAARQARNDRKRTGAYAARVLRSRARRLRARFTSPQQ